MSRPDEIVDRAARGLSHRLASRATRRSFLAGIAAGAFALVGARPAESRIAGVRGTNKTREGWYGFCGHTWTTGSCPSPFLLPRIDARGFPVRPSDGRPVDNLGRLIDAFGTPVDARGAPLASPDGSAAAAGPAHAHLRGLGARAARRRDRRAGRLVPLLQQPDPQAGRLLLHQPRADQRRRLAASATAARAVACSA